MNLSINYIYVRVPLIDKLQRCGFFYLFHVKVMKFLNKIDYIYIYILILIIVKKFKNEK